jgi:hypothetical protein
LKLHSKKLVENTATNVIIILPVWLKTQHLKLSKLSNTYKFLPYPSYPSSSIQNPLA